MEERESLKRQIDLLQNLIDKHKSVHGNMPRLPEVSTSSRGRSQSTSVINPHSSYGLPSHDSWRKWNSLKNKNPVSNTVCCVSTSTPEHSNIQVSSHNPSVPSHTGEKGRTSKPPTSSSEIVQLKEEGQTERATTTIRNVATEKRDTDKKVMAVPQSDLGVQSTQQQRVEETVVLPVIKVRAKASTLTRVSVISQFQSQPYLKTKTNKTKLQYPDYKKRMALDASSSPQSSPSKVPQQPFKDYPLSQSSQAIGRVSFQTKSKFTWVKNQTVEEVEPRPNSLVSSPTNEVTSTVVAKAGVLSSSSLSSPVIKRTPAKKSRKLSPVIAGPRASKYKWVSSSAGVQAKTFRKSPSPKALTNNQRALEKGDAMKKLKSGSFSSIKLKRGYATSPTSSSFSRYRWKAGCPRYSVAGTAGEAVALPESTFVWTAEKNKGERKGLVFSTLPSIQSSPNSFKLRSRMKIIRKSANSPNGSRSVKGGLPPAAKHSTRSHIHSLTRTPIGARRTHTRELVSFGKHKLRRLSPTSSRTSPAFSFHCTPASQRIFRPQYKMVNHPGSSAAYTLPYHPTLSWRAKKIQSARSFLQSRQRSSLNRYPATTHHWKESGMCWIRGNLYQVSANKLSRTVCHNMSINQTGRGSSFNQVSAVNSATNRPYSPRHFASRAVQRSLAIIRQARQKKQRQYCMYYNRFGKCNRGSSCPYIHDPDKVAVCTRFLRGTCKQPDGACPFSHKVAKEKMPVCSYFLKGICNNSNCPYSHVYVSRKAKVCEDFIKGFCPEGEKCKKKHTLVCPDFSKTGSCPLGTRCKLQHHQRAKRCTSTYVRVRNDEPSKRPCLSVVIPQGSQETLGTPSTSSLPSFISLSSSPEEADVPDPRRAKTTPVKEKNLQIKPRL
ncbi:zinc finger CCCH domain-containing protein 3 isoform X1 [Phyllopteryx taeniolatus]|uniref:zinc finger CCCH domain-containing protein 3 isoform X1 n=2 Tax=Phyllopteryx taeniolatus TaxID=161469 RepID=UPI002AD430AE|nr:zinc finger CCCH domain-containing protein 3 isoform X1 [Phyllopteryx taeniolatus]XP_061634037.1 zinc finger CCCH domain-containing protein 3 isoform X1 [Phyllopteryx taeniolatus]XP_061634038.1 zinc finger CCCH domain-containing protein 3 isoform X1 [Phyllopteryx taeniolatus]